MEKAFEISTIRNRIKSWWDPQFFKVPFEAPSNHNWFSIWLVERVLQIVSTNHADRAKPIESSIFISGNGTENLSVRNSSNLNEFHVPFLSQGQDMEDRLLQVSANVSTWEKRSHRELTANPTWPTLLATITCLFFCVGRPLKVVFSIIIVRSKLSSYTTKKVVFRNISLDGVISSCCTVLTLSVKYVECVVK